MPGAAKPRSPRSQAPPPTRNPRRPQPKQSPPKPPAPPSSAASPPRASAAIGPKATLDLTPGLTLVVGRNGSGKSSFAEGLGSLLDEGPSKLYDALSKVLGLDALVDAQAALQQARSTRDKARKEADQLATLLDHALRFHNEHGNGDCPVCGNKNAMDDAWDQARAREAGTLRQAATEATGARRWMQGLQ